MKHTIKLLDEAYANVMSIVKDENDHETINLIQPILDKIDEVQNELEDLVEGVEVINTEGLDEDTIKIIEKPMKFNRYWHENDTMFVELENSKGQIIRIFPERIKGLEQCCSDTTLYPDEQCPECNTIG